MGQKIEDVRTFANRNNINYDSLEEDKNENKPETLKSKKVSFVIPGDEKPDEKVKVSDEISKEEDNKVNKKKR